MASSSSFSDKHSRLPDDTVFYSIFPDSSTSLESLQSLHLQIMQTLTPLISDYIWQHQPFTLSPSSSPIPHLHGHLRFADNLADEWFVVFLLFHLSSVFPNLTIQLHDSDGDFLLIEAAFHLPRWLNPSTSLNRVFLRRANLHIVPRHRFPRSPTLPEALAFLANSPEEDSIAAEAVQIALRKKIAEYPEKALKNTHRVRVRVPPAVAKVLKEEPCLVALAVEGFYDRDIDTMKHAAKMERFLKEEEMVRVSVRISRAMYAQLAQQAFQAPKCYPAMPSRSGDSGEFAEAEMGMKIACGMEMMYQHRRKEGLEGRGSTWDAFRDSLERSGYFGGLIPGSKEYKRLMENAEEYYRSSASFSRAR